jgi:hypothetical protein
VEQVPNTNACHNFAGSSTVSTHQLQTLAFGGQCAPGGGQIASGSVTGGEPITVCCTD